MSRLCLRWWILVFSILCFASTADELLPICSEESFNACAALNKTCATNATTLSETCDQCLDGYIRFERISDDCFDINDLDFEEFKAKFQPLFVLLQEANATERLGLLIKVARFISSHNSQQPRPSYFLSLNAFSADTPEEARQLAGFVHVQGTEDDLDKLELPSANDNDDDFPDVVDWVQYGAVTSVKDQGRCGCCWAVALSGAIEGAAYINNGYFQSVSFQQFISCDLLNYGCNGGNLVLGMAYALQNLLGGMTTLNDYPFSDEKGSTTGTCNLGVDTPLAVDPNEGRIVVTFDQDLSFEERVKRMKRAVARQPVAMVLKSECGTFSSYGSGIVTSDGGCACGDVACIDHAVLMVGYDDTADPPFWRIKNSWGTGWGESGYMRVSQAESGPWGLFGLLAQGVVPLEATNVTDQVEDIPQTTSNSLETWQIVLIAVVCGIAILLLACCVMSFVNRRRKAE